MPSYEYRCGGCGFKKEYLQKLSDPLITDCPSCGKPQMVKLVSAAGFKELVSPPANGLVDLVHSGH